MRARSVAVVVVLSLLGCAVAEGNPRRKRPMTSPASKLDELLQSARLVVEGKVPPEEIAKRLGSISTSAGGTIYLKPRDPSYARAMVTFDTTTGRAQSASLEVAPEGAAPTIAELKARLGDYVEGVRTHFAAPLGLSFRIDFDPKLDRTCTVIAYVPNSHEEKDRWRVESLAVVAEMRVR